MTIPIIYSGYSLDLVIGTSVRCYTSIASIVLFIMQFTIENLNFRLNVFVLLIFDFFFSFVSSGPRELSDEFNTKLNLENQNEESDEKMHVEADDSSSSDDSNDEEEEEPIVNVCNLSLFLY